LNEGRTLGQNWVGENWTTGDTTECSAYSRVGGKIKEGSRGGGVHPYFKDKRGGTREYRFGVGISRQENGCNANVGIEKGGGRAGGRKFRDQWGKPHTFRETGNEEKLPVKKKKGKITL